VVLRLQPTAWLLVVPFSPTQVLLSLSSRTGTEVHQLSAPTKVRVPVGELDARALTVSRGQLLRATRHLVVKAGQTNRLDLEFVAAPAVSGVVMDAQGAPLAGVTVGLKLAPSNPGTPPRAQESALTDSRGHFELVPRLIRGGDPVYEVHVLPPWREQGRVLVRLGDQPLSITAEPAP
jgi:hypothetical protein